MRRQQLRRGVKRVFTGQLVESKLTCGSIFKPFPTVAGGNFPIFVVMIPQENGIGTGASLSKN